MKHVFDSSSFIVLKNFYPKAFPSLWTNLDELAANGDLFSVNEVYSELHLYADSDFIQDWAKAHRSIFADPSNKELLVVQEILSVPQYQAMISGKSVLRGTPVADPFVIAAAKVMGAKVITEEKDKPNSGKMPTVCKALGLSCGSLEEFMADQGWTF